METTTSTSPPRRAKPPIRYLTPPEVQYEHEFYSNKMRGQRDKRAAEEAEAAGRAAQIIDVSEHKPRRIPSAKWRELIKKVWEADSLLCPKCHREMRIVSLIDDHAVIERIPRHLGLWEIGGNVVHETSGDCTRSAP